jgi:acetyl-CoA carboxylase beta subunit
MDWDGFVSGVVFSLFVYALFSSKEDDVDEEDVILEHDDVEIHDFQSRHVTLSCQTCRKLKRHKEVEPNLFQCVKCKRHVDLRAS